MSWVHQPRVRMENMWLVAQSLGIGCQIMSVFSGNAVEAQVKQILDIPSTSRSLSRPAWATRVRDLRVRRCGGT